MERVIKILMLEDVDTDAFLAERVIKKDGILFTSKRVDTREEFTRALEEFHPDVILSDHSLPQFNSLEAYRVCKGQKLNVPFILVTGAVSDEFAVECLREGIDDYILKSNLTRLPTAIKTALERHKSEEDKLKREEEISRLNRELEGRIIERTKELEDAKNLSDTIINSLPGAFYVINQNHMIVKWNENFEQRFAGPAVDVRTIKPIDTVETAHRELFIQLVEEAFQKGQSAAEINLRTKTNVIVPYSVRAYATVMEGKRLVLVSGFDISSRKRTQEILRVNKERLDMAFTGLGFAWWDLDIPTGRLESHANKYRILGYDESEIKSELSWWSELLHPDDKESIMLALKNHIEGNTTIFDVEYRFRSKDGDWKWFQDLGKVVTRGKDGEPLRMIGTVQDISHRKKLEEELIVSKQNAEAANVAKGRFLANMSHEIRTPLNAIIGLSHLTLKTTLNDKQLDYLTKIRSSSQLLLGVINDVLDFSKIEAGKLSIEEVPLSLEEVFKELVDVTTFKARDKGLELAVGIDSHLPEMLVGDPLRLRQILINLTNNAVKFTSKGEVVVKALLVEEKEDRAKVMFSVRDTGIGISKETQRSLFAPFTQADNSTSRNFGGTGLGLSIVKRLSELMGGEAWVESEEGKGSTFYFTAWFGTQKEIHKRVPSIDLRNLPILVVDDNESVREILKEGLRALTFDVELAGSGVDALQLLKKGAKDYKVILIDEEMPGMDGMTTAAAIKNIPAYASTPVILMTAGHQSAEEQENVTESGLAGILVKPIGFSKLYDTLVDLFGNGINVREKKVQEQKPVSEKSHGKLLVAEDNEINQQVAGELLESFGFEVEFAKNGKEAVEMVLNSGIPSRYELIFMDIQMPIMSGYEAAEQILRSEAHRMIPIVAMTADAMGGVREKCLQAGMMDFVTKPIDPQAVLKVTQKWMGPSRWKMITESPKDGNGVKLPDKLPGIEIEQGLHRVGGNDKLYMELLLRFADDNRNFEQEAKDAFAKEDEPLLNRLIHTLKGTSGNLGMVVLQQMCAEMERQLRITREIFHKSIDPLVGELNSVRMTIQKNIVKRADEAPSRSIDEVRPLLNELMTLLSSGDPEAVNKAKLIGQVKGYEDFFELIEQKMRIYAFEEALLLLKNLK